MKVWSTFTSPLAVVLDGDEPIGPTRSENRSMSNGHGDSGRQVVEGTDSKNRHKLPQLTPPGRYICKKWDRILDPIIHGRSRMEKIDELERPSGA